MPEVTERNELAGDKGRITVLAYDEYDEDGSPVVDKPCEACDLSQYVDDDAENGGDAE